ncbi:MAG: 3'-5' exonuclease, partial [Eubacteriales bacterium]|nr:3'-5' exonuclease [Eubacteriales bacterium]
RRTLLREGIPVASGQDTGFFQSQEASVLLSLLTVIDNPRQDVPLISVLRSPVFGFTPDDLASVRSSASTGDFYSALTLRAAENDALGIRSARFLEQLENWRELAPDLGVEGLTAHMTEELHLDTLCAALPDGETRRENLQRFTELTRQYEADGWRGLYGFGTWLRRLAEHGEEQAAAAPPADNAVRILSIHKSKGLEFPVVFLADTARRFNRNDERRTVLVHQNLGLGPKITDLQRGIEYPGLARRAIAARIARESLSESLRVLYVAMTRARERIYISCAWRKPERVLEKLRDGLTNPVAPQLLETDLSPAHWLVRAALLDGSPIGLQICEPSDMFAGSDATDSISGTEPEPDTFNEQDNAVYEALCQRLNWVYPCAQAETMPSKITATSYKLPLPPDEDAAVLDAPPRRPVRRPELLQKRGLTAAERGTATHLTLQLMDFSRTDSAESIRKEAERLAALGNLTAEQLEAVDVRALLRFFRSETGRRILNADRLRREFRFSLLCPANTLTPGCDTDEVLLQGVVDCCFEENNELTVVDYKTDYVPPEGPAALVKRYTPQVQIYLTALSRVLGLPVREGILYFLRSGDAVSVPPDRKM